MLIFFLISGFVKFLSTLANKVSANKNPKPVIETTTLKFFLDILKTQLMLKGVIVDTDWNDMKNDIILDYTKDNHFSELKDAELLRERLQTLDQISQYVGTYFSKDYVMKNVLGFTDEDVEKMQDDAQKNQERIAQATDDEQEQ